MQLPLFFIETAPVLGAELELSEENSRHICAVLRMEDGEALQFTDGRGNLFEASIVRSHKKRTIVRLTGNKFEKLPDQQLSVAIALLKNAARFEWFLEKATELGIRRLIPLITARTEKQHFKRERFHGILVSAMMQSGQSWLPELTAPQTFSEFIQTITPAPDQSIFIAHCMDSPKQDLAQALLSARPSRLILIGPEGDFNVEEVRAANERGAQSVSLGSSRLRAETAGIVAATLLKLVNPPVL